MKTTKRQITPHKGGRTARLNIRLTPEQKAGIEQAAKLQNLNISDYIIKTMEDKMEPKFKNISDRYGDPVDGVTVQDYEELNPDGHFEIWDDEIREYKGWDQNADYEVIARK